MNPLFRMQPEPAPKSDSRGDFSGSIGYGTLSVGTSPGAETIVPRASSNGGHKSCDAGGTPCAGLVDVVHDRTATRPQAMEFQTVRLSIVS